MTYHHGNLRKELLDRAVHVIAEQGIESLSLRALARDLGVSHAAPSRHFADKTELLRALATEGNDRFVTYVLEAADRAGDNPLVRYAAMGKAYIRFCIEYPAYYRAITHPDVQSQADDELRATSERRRQVIENAARKAQDAGWLPDETTQDVVMYSIATVRGVAAMLNDPLHGPSMEQNNTDTLIESMVRMIIDPACPQKSLNPAKPATKPKGKRT